MSEAVKKIGERIKAITDLSRQALQDTYLAGYRDGYREALNLHPDASEIETKEAGHV